MTPYSSIFYGITGILLIILGSLIFHKNSKSPASWSLLAFVINMVAYMLSIYLGYYFVDPINPEFSTFCIRIAFLFGLFLTFSLCLFAYFYPKKTIIYPKKIEYLFFGATILMGLFAAFTDQVYEREIIVNGVEIEDVHGPFHVLFIFHYLFNSLLAVWVSMQKIQRAKGIEKSKTILSLVGILSVVLSIILFHTILPKFEIYLLQTEVVLFSLVFVALVFYSMLKYRFLDVSFTITKTAKVIIAICLASVVAHGLRMGITYFFPEYWIMELHLGILMVAIWSYTKIIYFFNSDTFHEWGWITNVEYFQKLIDELQNKNRVYNTLEGFEDDLRDTFCHKFKIQDLNILIFEKSKIQKLKHLIEFCENQNHIIVTQEIPFWEHATPKEKSNLEMEVYNLGEVFIPLRHSSQKIIGFLILGQKNFGDLYSKPEIERLKKLSSYLNLQITNILYNSELKKEVAQKTAELKQKNRELKKLDKIKDNFLAIASHELRTPMTIIKGYAEFLLSKKYGELTNKQEKFIQKIFQNTKDLTNLVNKMLESNTLESGEMRFYKQELDLVEFLSEQKNEFAIIGKTKDIKVKFENTKKINSTINIDREKLKIVCNNLLGNAYKFTQEGGKIILRINQNNTQELIISIEDNGIGIPKKDQKRIFSKFKQVEENLHKSYGGTGLGLAITKGIVEQMGGQIGVKSKESHGSTFWFTLPLNN